MSISVSLTMQGDITTPEHQAAIKKIMDAVEQATNDLPGIGYPIKPSRFESKTSANTRMLLADGTIDPTPFPAPTGFMHEAKMQFGFHLNKVTKPTEAAVYPDKQD
jgi:hypothetical protein